MKTKIITLPDATERQEKIKTLFEEKKILFDFICGVLPKDIIFDSKKSLFIFDEKTFLLNQNNILNYTKRNWIRFGEIAALMAHYRLWKILESDTENEFYLICEDDCLPAKQFNEDFLKSFDYSKIDFLYLQAVTAHYQDKNNLLQFFPFVEWDNNLKRINSIKNYFCEGMAAYCITKSGAKKLCQYIETNGYDGPVDNIVTRLDGFECFCPVNLHSCFYLDKTSEYSYTHSGTFKNVYNISGLELQSKEELLII